MASEVRAFLIKSVSKTGGHLASNLGTVELTIALHRVFDSPGDQIVWDVGHQCYTHKLLTGRQAGFAALRQLGGVSGFPSPAESEHDIFIAGHGSTAISAAIGLAQAKRLLGKPGKVLAIVGDGAFTGGMVYEGMNNIRDLNNLIVILNDNRMSISKNVGAMAQYLTRLRTSPHYFKAKRDVESVLNRVPVLGQPVKSGIQAVKSAFRRSLYHSTMFEEMGFQYVGPIDGHDIGEMCDLFAAYRAEQAAPLFVHLLTVKGKGYAPAEENPGEFHGVSAFDLNHRTNPEMSPEESFSTCFGKTLSELADQDRRICAITAAMKYGTGLQYMYKQHKERFFDVGMAEQHAVTFSAGLARGGMLPVVAIYSTFLQRAYDQIIHDVMLQDANVLLAIDRAGLVPGDGVTHQGIYDVAFLSQIDGLQVVSVSNFAELSYWLRKLLVCCQGPRALRYPRGGEEPELARLGCTGRAFDRYAFGRNAQVALVSYGAEVLPALQAAQMAERQGTAVDVYKLTMVHPLPEGLAEALQEYRQVVFAEEGVRGGGAGQHLASVLLERGARCSYTHLAVPNQGPTHASIDELRRLFGLDAEGLARTLLTKEGSK